MERFGYEAKLYYKTGGVNGGGAYNELKDSVQVNVTFDGDEAEFSSRASAPWEAVKIGKLKMTLEAELIWNGADADMRALKDAFMNRTLLGVKALDVDSGEGPEADMVVQSFGRNEPLFEGQTVSVTFRLTRNSADPTTPTWITP